MSAVKAGILTDKRVTQKIYSGIEKGILKKVDALVIHQTGALTAQHTFNSYAKGGHGAHFLIDKAGNIFQTAHLDKKTYHVGKVRSKCYELKVCSKAQLQTVTKILFNKSKSYPARVSELHSSEKAKSYPDRYPINEDSLGIEIVGNYNVKAKTYEAVSAIQNSSLQWLVAELANHFSITTADVYRHPEISYKMASEASSASW
ncbi:peptidoglycan recognition protein family protein [Hahella ganghwensis]|uniref:peptidoglycan recognition protein family protein n=1 Tax=Hahella ganghwensis TaxID=286420 RepID=UPI000370FE87|nr:peptidoglycan recognition family protein [Hahella ganghwensis]